MYIYIYIFIHIFINSKNLMGTCFMEKKNNNSLKNILNKDNSDSLSSTTTDKNEKINSW